jgi:hypothetical protein
MKKRLCFVIFLAICSAGSWLAAQDAPLRPAKIQKAVFFDVSPALCNMQWVLPVMRDPNLAEKEIPNKIGKEEFSKLKSIPFLLSEDPVWQKQDGTYLPSSPAPVQNFDGLTNISGFYPPDTQGDVSTDKYVQVVNVNFAIYSKTGALLFGPAALKTIWEGIPSPWNNTNSGDPVVLYDQEAKRWLITQFSVPASSTTQYAQLVAVSQTSDPTGAWYRYVFPFGSTMPDYPKFGVWPDGYYLSVNQFAGGATWAGAGACALERTKMLAGDPAAQMIYFNLGAGSEPTSMLPSDWDGMVPPAPGEANHFTYFNTTTGPETYLRIWDFHADWITPANSTFTQVSSLTTAPFDQDLCTGTRERCIPQPGTAIKLEALSDRLMYRLQYRNFGTHSAMVTNHTVDVDATGHAGIRWYELRNAGAGWNIHQQGTWSPDASNRWVGSIAMNSAGDIALGYSVSDATSTFPSIRYTGRKAGDLPGTMTLAEQSVIAGTGSQTGTAARWGDYSMMSVDPSDDITFWYTTEYVQVTGNVTWKTRIASFNVSNAPSAVAADPTAITTNSATLNGNVNPRGLATNYHFEYGNTSALGSLTPVVSAGSGTSAVNVAANISGLAVGMPCYFRLVAINSDGTSTSNELTFIPGAAILITTTPSAITQNSASSGGNISFDGGVALTARGVCWGLAINPTTAESHTTNGAVTGVFTSSITGLLNATTYHVRAYATNSAGTFYGNDIVFTTACGTSGMPFFESFSNTLLPSCWSQVDNQGNGKVWQFGTLAGNYAGFFPALTGNYVFLNSNGYGSGNTENADLITSSIDMSGYASVTLSFKYYFRFLSPSSGALSYSIDNGVNWVLIESYTATSANPATFSQSFPVLAGQPQVKFKWNYTGTFARYWAIDDVNVTGVPTVGIPVNRQLSNISLVNGATNCFNASQTITVAGSGNTFTVQNGGNVTMIAGVSIDMLPGTTVQSGGYLLGSIAPSGPFCPTPSGPEFTTGTTETTDGVPTAFGGLFKVYPNPTTGKFTLELSVSHLSDIVRVEIFGIRGEKILSKEVPAEKYQEFSLTDAPVGLYFVRVYAGDKAETIKLVKF